jgi:toxin ParE1/3/4
MSMVYSVQLQEEAILDLRDIYDWYEHKRKTLGDEFLDEFENSLTEIALHPQHYFNINEHLRRYHMNRFPYIIIFETEGSALYINAVRHTAQKPKF